MEDIKQEITKALKAMGISGTVRVEKEICGRCKVYVNGKYHGIYDLEKNTFVD